MTQLCMSHFVLDHISNMVIGSHLRILNISVTVLNIDWIFMKFCRLYKQKSNKYSFKKKKDNCV